MLVHPWDGATNQDEWTAFVRGLEFGTLIASGRDRPVPVAVPTQFVLVSPALVVLHLARPNPVWRAIDENPLVLLAVSGDWAYVPAAWKAIGDEDPAYGIPTTYYAAVLLTCRAEILDDAEEKATILRAQLGRYEPGSAAVDPLEHGRTLTGIRGLRLHVTDVRAKFKYGGNVDAVHREAVAQHLRERAGPGDAAAVAHLVRRS